MTLRCRFRPFGVSDLWLSSGYLLESRASAAAWRIRIRRMSTHPLIWVIGLRCNILSRKDKASGVYRPVSPSINNVT
jgi:hypothetical protein